jgi:hypothetical protein
MMPTNDIHSHRCWSEQISRAVLSLVVPRGSICSPTNFPTNPAASALDGMELSPRTWCRTRLSGRRRCGRVCARGLDPAGMEDTGRYYADFYLSRPAAEAPQVALGGAGGQGGLMARSGRWGCRRRVPGRRMLGCRRR